MIHRWNHRDIFLFRECDIESLVVYLEGKGSKCRPAITGTTGRSIAITAAAEVPVVAGT